MYKNGESFIAESHGRSVGRRQGEEEGYKNGRQEGYDRGHTAGWNEAIEADRPEFENLQRQRDKLLRERDELLEVVNHASKQNQKWMHGFNSLLCILDSAMGVLQNAPQSMRTQMVMDYSERAGYMKTKEMIHTMPSEDSVVRTRAPSTAAQMKGWWDQVLAHAKKAAEKTSDHTDSPTP